MRKALPTLLFSIFAVMIGFGVTLPVLPFFTERLALAEGASRQSVAIHVGLLTAAYALMQLLMAPVWGHWSDRIGRRQMVLTGIAGSIAAQLLFAISVSLWLLYVARIVGGILSSALLPAAAAYVADVTGEHERSKGMAWVGTSTSLGAIAGIALGGFSAQTDLHLTLSFAHFRIDGFSVPFFLAALLMFGALLAAWRWLPESTRTAAGPKPEGFPEWRRFADRLRLPLGLGVASQFGLTLFEGTFALFAKERLQYGPAEVGAAFAVCGGVMAIFQVPAAALLGPHWSAYTQVWSGLTLMALGSVLLLAFGTTPFVLASVAVLALGAAIITPNLAALVSRNGGNHTGMALGAQSAANSLGQFAGPLIGSVLFAWQTPAPYAFGSAFLFSTALLVATQSRRVRKEPVDAG